MIGYNYTWSKWIPLTKAALATTGFLSTIACFKYLSIWVRSVPSVIRQRTRIAFARYTSVLLFMSFIRELVTIITFSEKGICVMSFKLEQNQDYVSWENERVEASCVTSSEEGESSFIIKYTILLKPISLAWKSFVTEKKTSVASTYKSKTEKIMSKFI